MKAAQVAPSSVTTTAVESYAAQLMAYEVRRRAKDDVLLRGMMQLRDPMNPP